MDVVQHKVLVLGGSGVGKTRLISKLISSRNDESLGIISNIQYFQTYKIQLYQ